MGASKEETNTSKYISIYFQYIERIRHKVRFSIPTVNKVVVHMSGEVSVIDVKEMADLLDTRRKHGKRTLLLLGARAGGLYRSYTLYDTLKPFSKLNFATMSRSKQFEECYELLKPQRNLFSDADRSKILSDSIRDVSLIDADVRLAQLIKDGYFETVISTNIDDILEQALSDVGWRESKEFRVLNFHKSEDLETIQEQRDVFCRLIKIFGDVSSVSYDMSANNIHMDNKSTQHKGFLEKRLKEDILVLGLDPTWDERLLSIFPASADGHYWFVNEQEFDKDASISLTWKGRTMKKIVGSEGSYDNFMRELYWHLGKGKIPGQEHLIRGIHATLQMMQNELINISSELRLIQAKLTQLHSHSSEKDRSKDQS